MSEEEATSSLADANGADDDDTSASSRGRGRGGRGDSRGRGRGGGRGRGRGRGGASNGDSDAPTDDTPTEGDDSLPTDGAEGGDGRGRGRGRGRGGRGRGRGGGPRPLREVPRPDDEAWATSVSSHTSTLSTLKSSIDGFTVKVESSVKARKAVREELRKAQAALDTVVAEKAELFGTYNRMKDHIASIDSSSISRKRDLETAKRELSPYLTTADVDAAIKAAEKQLNSRTLVIAEERAKLDEVKKLRGMRAKVFDYEKKAKETGSSKEEVEQLVGEREAAHASAFKKKEEEETGKKTVAELTKKEKKLSDDIDGFIAQRRELLNKRQTEERDWSIREETYNRQMKDYDSYAREKAWRDGEDERRAKEKADYEARQARREQWAADKAQREEDDRAWREEREREEALRDPYEKEKNTVQELLKYMDKLSVKRAGDEDDGDEDADEKQQQLLTQRIAAFGGKAVAATPLTKAKKGGGESLFSELVQPKAPKRVKAKKANKALTHVPDVFALFREVEVPAPMMSTDIEGTIEKLKVREQYYETAPRPAKKGRKKAQTEEGGEQPEAEEADEADAEEGEEEEEEVQVTGQAEEVEAAE